MKYEYSAGGIVLRKAQAFSSEAQARRDFGSKPQFSKKNFEVLIGQHSQHHGWVFPKGIIGDHIKGEDKENTAVREVKEETGITGKIIKSLRSVTYLYQFKEEKIKKTVYYFLMEYLEGDTKDHDSEMENVEWIPIEEVTDRLTYKSDKQVWQEAKKIITKNT